MHPPLVRLENAGLFIPGDKSRVPVLRGINWDISPNSHWMLAGANGSGKSTLLRLLHGELWLNEGSITWMADKRPESSPIAGRAISSLVSPAKQENWQRMAWNTTSAEMLADSIADASADHKKDAVDPRQILAALGGDKLAKMPLPSLSQGQLRLVLLTMALAKQPKLLLLDECVDGLDEKHKKSFFSLLESIAHKTTIIFTTHHAESLPDWVDNFCALQNGTLIFGAAPASQKPNFSANTISATPECVATAPTKVVPLLAHVSNVDVYVDRNLALRNINWDLRQGEHWRITGDNGSGKSTFLRLLAGDELAAAGGRVERFCPKAGNLTVSLEEIRRDFCLVSDLGQAVYGYPLTGLELVCSGFDNSIGLYRDITTAEKVRAQTLMTMFFGLQTAQALAEKSIRQMSSGQLRGLHLCRALAARPAVLLLDEPCTGLDASARATYLNLLDRLAAGAITSYLPQIVFVSHYEDDAPACINRLAEMRDGRLTIIR